MNDGVDSGEEALPSKFVTSVVLSSIEGPNSRVTVNDMRKVVDLIVEMPLCHSTIVQWRNSRINVLGAIH